MSFEETFGNIVGYSIYFVVGTIWLAFLGFGICVVLYFIVRFCMTIPCWGIAFSWIGNSIGTVMAKLIGGATTVTEFTKIVLQSLPGILQRLQEDVASSLRQSGAYRPTTTDSIAMAESGARNSSDQTPLLHEHDNNDNDHDNELPETKIDIIVDPPSRHSTELPTSNNTERSRIGLDQLQ